MPLSKKENAKRAIHFQKPDYIPLMYYNMNQIHRTDVVQVAVQTMFGGENGRTSEWGFVWKEHDTPFALGQIETPALPDWDLLENYRTPDVHSRKRFETAYNLMSAYPDKYFIADFVLSGFTTMSFVRGFEDFMADMYLEREKVEKLADIVCGAESELIRACAQAGFDAIGLADDLGSQQSLLFSAELFREIFKPRLAAQIALAHSLGLDVCMHSCGYIMDIIPDLIEIGLDILNPGQPDLNGVRAMGERFKGQICFACPVGYQTTGITGSPEEIDTEVKSYVDELSLRDGGLIGFVASALKDLGSTDERQTAVWDAWHRHCGEHNPYRF